MSSNKVNPAGPERLVTLPQAAADLAISVRSAWRLLSRGDLQKVQVGRAVRVTRDSIDAFIAKGGAR